MPDIGVVMVRWKEGGELLEVILGHIYEKKLLGNGHGIWLDVKQSKGGLKESQVTSSSEKV